MGEWTDIATCWHCAKDLEEGDRVVVKQVTGGIYRELDEHVEYDTYDMEKEIYHEKCCLY